MRSSISMLLSAWLALVAVAALGQPTVTWTFYASRKSTSEFELHMDATLQPGWRLYSHFLEGDGPIPTTFSFQSDENYSLKGTVEENGAPIVYFDETFGIQIRCYEHNVSFTQQIVVEGTLAFIKGTVEYMTCSHDTCIPAEQEFRIKLPQ